MWHRPNRGLRWRSLCRVRGGALGVALCWAVAAGGQQPNTIQVSAQGQVKALADTAIVVFAISGEDQNLGAAYKDAQSLAEKTRGVLAAQHLALDEAQLTSYTASQQNIPQRGGGFVLHYVVTAVATLELTDFSRIDPLLNALGDADLPVVRSLTFTLRNWEAFQNGAIADGDRQAHAEAAAVAAARGRKLGAVINENVSVNDGPRGPATMGAIVGGSGSPPAPTEGFATRQITITAYVSATYAMAP